MQRATLLPTREDWRRALGPILRGSGVGFVIGIALGLPSTPASATMMVALLIHGVKPGPMLME